MKEAKSNNICMEIHSFEEILRDYPLIDGSKDIHQSLTGQHLQIHKLEIHANFDNDHLLPYFEAGQTVEHDNLLPVSAAFF